MLRDEVDYPRRSGCVDSKSPLSFFSFHGSWTGSFGVLIFRLNHLGLNSVLSHRCMKLMIYVEKYDTLAYRSSPLWLVPIATHRSAFIFLLFCFLLLRDERFREFLPSIHSYLLPLLAHPSYHPILS